MTPSLMYADRSERGKLRLTGPQRAWFLHQILTQDFESIAPGEGRPAALLTAHGRMVGYMEVVATDDALLMHFEPELLDTLPAAISRYVLATDVAIEDVTDSMDLLLVAGKGALDVARDLGRSVTVHETAELGIPAAYVWIERGHLGGVAAAVAEKGAVPATEEELEAIRIANGVPRWGRDMDEKTFPQEVGIDERAVHYDKGCYVGQEAMAKIHLRGKVNRRLRVLEAKAPLSPRSELVAGTENVGTVTSVSGTKALGMLRYTIYPGDVVKAGELEVRVAG